MDLDEQTRQGKNICPKCNNLKEMYYKPWCPRCEPPELRSLETLNLIQSLDHLEAIGHEGLKGKIWGWLMDSDALRGNDTYIHIFPPEDPIDDKELETFLKVFFEFVEKQTKKEPGEVLFEVSW